MKRSDLAVLDGGRPSIGRGHVVIDWVWQREPDDPNTAREVRRSPLADAVGKRVRFEDAGPSLPFLAWKGMRNFPGWWWTATNGRHVGFESWLERDRLTILDREPDIVGISSQPMVIYGHDRGGEWTHVPDYFCRRADGSGTLVDVCTSHAARKDRRRLQADRTRQVCEDVGWSYEWVQEPDRTTIVNLRWLAGYRRPAHDPWGYQAALLEACDRPTPLRRLAEAVDDPVLVLPVLFHMIWHLDLTVDVTRPLLSTSLVEPVHDLDRPKRRSRLTGKISGPDPRTGDDTASPLPPVGEWEPVR